MQAFRREDHKPHAQQSGWCELRQTETERDGQRWLSVWWRRPSPENSEDYGRMRENAIAIVRAWVSRRDFRRTKKTLWNLAFAAAPSLGKKGAKLVMKDSGSFEPHLMREDRQATKSHPNFTPPSFANYGHNLMQKIQWNNLANLAHLSAIAIPFFVWKMHAAFSYVARGLLAAPPWKPLLRVWVLGPVAAMMRGVLCDSIWCVYCPHCPCLSVSTCVRSQERAKIRAHSSILVGSWCWCFCASGAYLDGGTIWSLSIKVPRGDSSGEGGAAHGPLHLAMHRSLETLMAVLACFSLWSWFWFLVALYRVFCVWGWYLVWLFSPWRLDPFLVSCLVSSLSLFSCWAVRRRRCLFSFSGAGETQARCGLGFPLSLFPADTDFDLDPYIVMLTYTQVTSRTCFPLSVFGFVPTSFCTFFFLPFSLFLRDKAQVITGRTPRAFCGLFLFSFFVPAALVLSSILAVCPFFWRFVGVPFWAPRVCAISDSFGTLGDLRLLAPSEALFLDARRQGFSGRFFLLFLFSPSVVFAAFSQTGWRVERSFARAGPRVFVSAPRPSEGPGAPSSAAVWTQPFEMFFFCFFIFGRKSPGPSDAWRPGPFFGEGRALLPLQAPFPRARVFFPLPRVFFSSPGPRGLVG